MPGSDATKDSAKGARAEPSSSAAEEAPLILIVDDEAPIRDVVMTIARRADPRASFITAEDAFKAEALVREKRPRGILTDLRMPGRSGLELLALVAEVSPGTRRALMTGFQDDVIDGVALEDLGLVGMLRKPFKAADLAKLLQQLAT